MLAVRQRSPAVQLVRRGALVLAGSVLMYVSAQIAVPAWPVPVTLQTLAIPVLVALLGRDLATGAVAAYLVEGALGLPVFSGHAGGFAVLLGPTAGYLVGFPLAAYEIGTLYRAGLERSYAARFVAVFLGTALVFVTGAAWLDVALTHNAARALALGVTPFIIGDLAKCLIAAALPARSAAR
ncbi:MAG: biotin transporter BioY [Candidatus Eremiobacteraeota bacterium]|nr:biotin transporter BioY [Candidatus Eremiobacteraeota bacterium]